MATTAQPSSPDTRRSDGDGPDRRRSTPTRWLAVAAATAVVAGGGIGVLALRDDRGAPPTATASSPVALELPGGSGGPVSASCMPFEVRFLRDMPVAFAGTVTSLDDDQVRLSVDRWYRGTAQQTQADAVTVAVPPETSSAALDGVDFRTGETYLLTATDGTVNGCGYSGPRTAELEAAYAEAFGG